MKHLAANIIPVLVFLLVAMNAAHVESRRSGMMYQLYVFGDSYADTGNVPKSNLSRESRQWYKPYGNPSPSGRFSNRFVQSDFIASWLGHHEAPQTFRLRNRNDIRRFGMNFAVAGSGVLEVPEKVATLSKQVDNFEGLIKDRTFPPWRLRFSLALVRLRQRLRPPRQHELRRRHATGSDDETLAKTTFKNKLRPSCESFDPKGYCGHEDENGSPQYSVTDDLSKDMSSNFYWDDVHPHPYRLVRRHDAAGGGSQGFP
ncbi:unnamed protein product [Miscanthus lutarioriparius]|uniref:GDSL esterase/lipase n=1 Tax=Miscanthus lutarioriparius TaxID=422564 RepID=A0A811NIS3_9POAL|nr:unnamed protein product [Miscanthus lutarioriparius]